MDDRTFPIEVEEGDIVGRCPECGPVVRDDVAYRFPNPSWCGICERELQAVTIAEQETQIAEP